MLQVELGIHSDKLARGLKEKTLQKQGLEIGVVELVVAKLKQNAVISMHQAEPAFFSEMKGTKKLDRKKVKKKASNFNEYLAHVSHAENNGLGRTR